MALDHQPAKKPLTVSVPYSYYYEPLLTKVEAGELGDVRLVRWGITDEPSGGVLPRDLDMVVIPFHTLSDNPSEEYRSTRNLRTDLPTASNARLIQAPSIGVEGLVECLPKTAVLSNATGVMEAPTAELAIALLLTLLREIPGFFRSAGTWDNHRTKGLMDAKVLLLGYGGVGQATEQRLRPFGVEVIRVASNRKRTPDGQLVHGVEELYDLLPTVDAVICSLPLTTSTTGLVGAGFFEALPVGAAFVNVGRGAVVITADLIDAATSGRLVAALDVTDPEPLPSEHPLWRTTGVTVTPHVGGNTNAARRLQVELLAQQIRRINNGEPPLNIVEGTWN